jgi:hypothetical protein
VRNRASGVEAVEEALLEGEREEALRVFVAKPKIRRDEN